MTSSRIEKQITEANIAYREGHPIISDTLYDDLVLKWEKMTGKKWTSIGAMPSSNAKKIKLPMHMGSLTKVKPPDVEKWIKKYPTPPYMVSDKLDGISLLLEYSEGYGAPKVYTRGNGDVGCDASKISPYVGFPSLKMKKRTMFRGELVIPKNMWSCYKSKYKNPRNAVAGIINTIVCKPAIPQDVLYLLMHIHFVVFDAITPGKNLTKREELKLARNYGFKTVCTTEKSCVHQKDLTTYLQERRNNSEYEIDGLVVWADAKHRTYPASGNPKFAVAFKTDLTDQKKNTVVTGIEWNASKHGILKPVVLLLPVDINGTKISRATGYNAKWIHAQGINVGSKVILIKSGDVIPKILTVEESVEEKAFPTEYEWKWVSDIDIGLVDHNDTVLIKKLVAFATKLGIEGLKKGTATKLVKAGIKTAADLLTINLDTILGIDGFKKKSATKMHNSIIEKFKSASSLDLLAASNAFGAGFGSRKLAPVMKIYPNLPMCDVDPERLKKVPGYSTKSVDKFMKALPAAREWFQKLPPLHASTILERRNRDNLCVNTSKYAGCHFVFSGFRNKELAARVEAMGAVISSSVTKKTKILVVVDPSKDTGKTKKARKMGVTIMTVDEFKDTLQI